MNSSASTSEQKLIFRPSISSPRVAVIIGITGVKFLRCKSVGFLCKTAD